MYLEPFDEAALKGYVAEYDERRASMLAATVQTESRLARANLNADKLLLTLSDTNRQALTRSETHSTMPIVVAKPQRKTSVVHNVVVPSHLLNSINISGQYSSVNQEKKRRESKLRLDPRETFDVASFASHQSAVVLRALDQPARSALRRPSVSPDSSGRRRTSIYDRPNTGTQTVSRKSSMSAKVEPILTPGSGSLKRPPPVHLSLPRKSVVTFSEPPTPGQRTPGRMPRKKSVVTFSKPETPQEQSEKRRKSTAAFSDTTTEATTPSLKEFLQDDYFGNYSFESSTTSQPLSKLGPLDTSEFPETPGTTRNTGWMWGEKRPTSSGTPSSGRRPSTGQGRGRRRDSVWVRTASVFQGTAQSMRKRVQSVAHAVRRSSMYDNYEKAKVRGNQLHRSPWLVRAFEIQFYLILLAILYFVLIGLPLWNGSIYWLYYGIKYKLVVKGSWAILIGIAFIYAYLPLLMFFEDDPPMHEELEKLEASENPGVESTCLLIPCYKSANIIGATLKAALKVFPATHIFVIANGNSPIPLDNTEDICQQYGVTHVWSPIGSKIVAQFVGCYAARGFNNVLLIDDDCILPPNMPICTGRMVGNVKCIGYTIKSVGSNSSRGTLAQQAQDLEYKLSGIQKAMAGKIGAATFPHGAISLWDREFLIKTFHQHPGFSVSEDWFFGHVARQLGCRTQMCTSVFIETETPDAVFFSSSGSRGGFGEMTVFKQRFTRWNFFFVNGIYYNLAYILTDWKLGWWEIGTKIFVFQEIYETLLNLAAPFILPISFVVRPLFCTYLFVGVFFLYFINAIIFNEVHLRRKNERVGFRALYLYFMPYKVVLMVVNVASCYWALFKYATYFAQRHPKVIEDEKAVGVVLQLEESMDENTRGHPSAGRRMTISAIGAQTQIPASADRSNGLTTAGGRRLTITTLGARLDSAQRSGRRESSVGQPPTLSIGGNRFSITNIPEKTPSSRASLVPSVPSLHLPSPADEKSGFDLQIPTQATHTRRGSHVSLKEQGRPRLMSVVERPETAEDAEETAADEEKTIANISAIYTTSSRPGIGGLRPGTASTTKSGSRADAIGGLEPLSWSVGESVPLDLRARLAAVRDRLGESRIEVVDFEIGEEGMGRRDWDVGVREKTGDARSLA